MSKSEVADKVQPNYELDDLQPSVKEQAVVKDVFYKFRKSADERNQRFSLFDNRNLFQYINDSVKRYITNVDERDGLEDWQARINDPFIRNKVTAVLGKVVAVLPIAQMMPRGDDDIRKAPLLNDLYQYSEEKSDYEEFMVNFLLEAIVKGTAVGYEGVEYDRRQVRDVKGTGDNLTETAREIKETKLFAEVVPLEEFYPSSVSIRTIERMPYCFWRKEYSYSDFISRFGFYAKSKKVKPSGQSVNTEQRPFYADYISDNLGEGLVEVIRYYDIISDQYVIIANGVWLNPLGNEVISPMPFNHKKLPFFSIKFDFLGDWFYGKSLPDKLGSIQDVLNVLTNMMLDQSFLTIFPPMLTAGFDSIEDDYLRPGRRTPIDTQGLPISQAVHKLDMGVPTGWHQFILQYTRGIMEEASVDKVSQGIAGGGDRTTAQEIRVAAEGVAATLGLFGRLINYGLKQKATLRVKNILQFWTDPKSPMLVGVLGEEGDKLFNKAFNLYKINNTTLSSGKRGTKVIAFFADQDSLPSQKELKVKSAVTKARNKKEVEYVALDAAYIRNSDFDVKIVMDEKKENTRDIEKALHLEKVRVYLSLFPPGIFNVNELAAQTAEKMGDDPTKILNQDVVNQMLQPPQSKEAAKPMSPTPQSNVGQNMTDTGAQGMSGGLQQMAQLAGSMTG